MMNAYMKYCNKKISNKQTLKIVGKTFTEVQHQIAHLYGAENISGQIDLQGDELFKDVPILPAKF